MAERLPELTERPTLFIDAISPEDELDWCCEVFDKHGILRHLTRRVANRLEAIELAIEWVKDQGCSPSQVGH